MTKIHWQTLGTPTGLPALAIHCALGRGRDLGAVVGAVIPPLAALALDLPGHGASAPWEGAGDYHDLCTDAARAGLDQPRVVIGHSLGATIALRLALESAGNVRALVLIEPVLFAAAKGSAELAAHKAHDDRFAACLAAGDATGAAALFLDLWGAGVPFGALPDRDQRRICAQMPLITATVPALSSDHAALLQLGRLEKLDIPVLLVRGANSPNVISAIHAALAKRLPHVRHAQITGATHMSPLTHPQQVAAQISAFLQAQE